MFYKESFTEQDKKKAKSHWAKFSEYLDYQDQQGTIPRQQANLAEIKSMFKFTLQDSHWVVQNRITQLVD